MFFCLDAKEPKNQGRPERSAHSSVPAPPFVWLALLTIGLLLLNHILYVMLGYVSTGAACGSLILKLSSLYV